MPDLLLGRTTSPSPPLLRSLGAKKPTRIWPQIWQLRIYNPPTGGICNDRGYPCR
ncbi:hypothetical protein RHMOL_Rhmol10G0175600 [Rhododendron molle]|uniref:Uncharacterized protein n=1 Tax=Rhododendron molle TaxID=49168 RepID=A0ACC0M538_RHOML|nr:hypothetical protein RHMOL_Rhmol10G0175600 [Rhododendron molle]